MVTKVKPNDDEFDLDHCRETLGRILDVLLENFMTEFELTFELIADIEQLKQEEINEKVAEVKALDSEKCITDRYVIY